MPRRSDVGERRGAVLRAVVYEHIRTGDPVGSGAVATRYRLRVSPATIRNEMSALEELGYLVQPHTSAGRIPTDAGYRYYVDTLPAPRVRDAHVQAATRFLGEPDPDVEETLRGTTQLLSRLTRHAALAVAPRLRESRVVRGELVPFGSACLLLVVMDTGRVEKRLLALEADRRSVETAGRTLTHAVGGVSLREAREAVRRLAERAPAGEQDLLRAAADGFSAMERDRAGHHVILGGASNLAGAGGFDRREAIRGVFQALEREAEVLRVLETAARHADVTVTIGAENPVTATIDASLVVAPYRAGDRPLGTIAVVGPTRMDYSEAISAVRAVARRLSEVIADLAR